MKKFIISSIFMSSFSASATPLCERISKQAEGIMQLRQSGTPFRDAYSSFKGHGLYQTMVEMVYMEKVEPTEKLRKEAANAFGNKVFGDCIFAQSESKK